jgi:hypothetical protein
MRAIAWGLPILLLPAGCSGSESASASDQFADTGRQFAWNERGQNAIKSKLKDPESALFRNVKFHSSGGIPVTCGEVNAKNGFGGYSGFERFIAAGDTLQVLESEMVNNDLSEVWNKYCL